MATKKWDIIKRRFGIIGRSSALHQAIETATQVAPTHMSVLISGENGTGKESFAKLIHTLSRHQHGKFIAVNCGAIPEGTIDSELFGHEKGSFTSAEERRKGYFEEAHNGTIFLDEIGEMPLHTQPRLLRVLESKTYMRVGSSQAHSTNARVVAATNVNLLADTQLGKFREDLYYRIAQVQITIPPLRERQGDIFLLFRKFALDFAEEYQVAPIQLTEEASSLLKTYPFPGNIRQLRNITWQLSLLASNEAPITATTLTNYLPAYQLTTAAQQRENFSKQEILYKVLFDMQQDMQELKQLTFELLTGQHNAQDLLQSHARLFQQQENPPTTNRLPTIATRPLKKVLKPKKEQPVISLPSKQVSMPELEVEENLSIHEKEKELIVKALKRHKKKSEAAKSLAIAERTLYRKIKEYGL